MVSTGKSRFEIAQHGVDPAELGQIPRFAATCDDNSMPPPRIDYAVEKRKAIGQDLTFGIQSGSAQFSMAGPVILPEGNKQTRGMMLSIS